MGVKPPEQPGHRVCVVRVWGGVIPQRKTEKVGRDRCEASRTTRRWPFVCLITSTQTREDSLAQWFGGGECRGVFLQSRGGVYKVQEMWVS